VSSAPLNPRHSLLRPLSGVTPQMLGSSTQTNPLLRYIPGCATANATNAESTAHCGIMIMVGQMVGRDAAADTGRVSFDV
jgi:hypothetical protein